MLNHPKDDKMYLVIEVRDMCDGAKLTDPVLAGKLIYITNLYDADVVEDVIKDFSPGLSATYHRDDDGYFCYVEVLANQFHNYGEVLDRLHLSGDVLIVYGLVEPVNHNEPLVKPYYDVLEAYDTTVDQLVLVAYFHKLHPDFIQKFTEIVCRYVDEDAICYHNNVEDLDPSNSLENNLKYITTGLEGLEGHIRIPYGIDYDQMFIELAPYCDIHETEWDKA